jgi:hypothetical protein
VTPDNERQRACREAVWAFRLAAIALKDPAPVLFADLSVEEGLQDLTQEPPLASFSPFEALPDGVLAGLDEPAYLSPGSSGSGGYLDPATGHGAAPLAAGRLRPSGSSRGSRDLLATASSQYDESAVQPPVFSFRRSGPAVQRQPSQRNQDMIEDSTKKAESKPYTGRSYIPKPTPKDRRPGALVAVDAQGDLPGMVRPDAESDDARLDHGTGTHTADERVSDHPMTILNDLTDEALEAVRSRTPEGDVRPSNTSPPQPVPPGEWMIRSLQPGQEVSGRDDGSERGVRSNTSGVRGLSHSVTPNGLADGLLETGDRRSDLSVQGSGDSPLGDVYRTEWGGDLPEFDHEAYGGGSAIALIESLTEHLLASQKTVAALSRPDENVPPGVGTSTISDVVDNPEETRALEHSSFALLESVYEEPISGPTFGPASSDTYKGVPRVASGRCMDAETFASLVNDVLVEQARRHGVDLS